MQYDGVGNWTRLQWPANTNGSGAYFVTYRYDALNRLTEIDENGSISAPLAKYQWDALSRLSLITYGDGTTDAYAQYDAGDNLQTLAMSFTGGTQNNVTFSYSWLKNHQRQSVGVNNSAFQYVPATGTVNYSPANVNNGYTTAGGVNLTYDGNANLTYDGFNTLTYDVENRLISAQNGAAGQSLYSYDPVGHRSQKQSGGVTTQFVLAGDEEIADFTGSGVGIAQMLTVRGIGGLPVAAVQPATAGSAESIVYYHHDVLGSTVAGTAPGQAAAEVFSYGEFGAPGAGSALTYRFVGYRYDTETGLYYVRARYYSPVLGRFLQTDPIGLGGGTNLYAYVGNDPVNGTDPSGLMADKATNAVASAWSNISNFIGDLGQKWWVQGLGSAVVAIGSFAEGNPGPAEQLVEQEVPVLEEATANALTGTALARQLGQIGEDFGWNHGAKGWHSNSWLGDNTFSRSTYKYDGNRGQKCPESEFHPATSRLCLLRTTKQLAV